MTHSDLFYNFYRKYFLAWSGSNCESFFLSFLILKDTETETAPDSPDVHFEPVVKLAPVETRTLEEDEDILFTM